MDLTNGSPMEQVCLKLDNGGEMNFKGRLFSESSWYDEDEASLTTQKLYVTDSHEQVYSVVSGDGKTKERRAYRINMHGDSCTVNNGSTEMTLPFDMLMLAVRSLCRLEDDATPSLETVEETLRAANC
ncbi:hypothetical protein JBF11_09265 [Taurinivorans muris]|jgi:hypothetical protein|uniref:Uncharacterized protein n=1 Tax=Taurinivorans muris TaxID=2787751 RepID=A0ABY5Y2Z7_9BACT|nr:hypothetical protein [Mailhella sp.]UWX05618.1 hypothetical protein JBF11_09265 [Desulfovibrionaceae bacterium LT0009]HBV41659.1 hypothetical protein [Desulfovibrio sp.]